MGKRRGKGRQSVAALPVRATESSPALPPPDWRYIGLLFLLTVVAYGPIVQAGFIWDDDQYVTLNKTLRNTAGLERIWFDRHANPQYYPLVHTTF